MTFVFMHPHSRQHTHTHTHGPPRRAFCCTHRICGHSAARGGFSVLTCSMGSASRICALIGAGVAVLVAPPVGGPGMRSRIRRCSMHLHNALTRLGRSRGSATLIASAAATCARLSCIRDCPNILTSGRDHNRSGRVRAILQERNRPFPAVRFAWERMVTPLLFPFPCGANYCPM
jgi:hypothetical protein